ncbi:MAG: hypothetical protein PHF84_02755 [bacterium]|nr:hypothetical protein [bacterium]
MKKKIKYLIYLLCFCFQVPALADWGEKYSPDETFSVDKPFILLDFAKKEFKNTLNADFGVFDLNPYDKEAYCRMSLVKDPDAPGADFTLKILYDVDSKEPAFNGFWTKLRSLDLSGFEAVVLTIRGIKEKGFSDFFKMELKDSKAKMKTDVMNITDQWTSIIIPFREFESENEPVDLRDLQELTLVFEDWRLEKKEGGYEIREIGFIPAKGVTVKWKDMIKDLMDEQEQSRIKLVVQEKNEEILVNIIDAREKLFDGNRISRDGKEILNQVAGLAGKQSYKRIIIMMYPSRTGGASSSLSEKEARVILFYLTNHGLDYKKIEYRVLKPRDDKGRADILIIRWKKGEEEKYKYFFYMGLDAYVKENYKEALKEWGEALKFDPENADLKGWIQKARAGLKKK